MIAPIALIAGGILFLTYSAFGVEPLYNIHMMRSQRARRVARVVLGFFGAAFVLLGVSILAFPDIFR